ncbi:MAG: hypothetical protein GY944_03225 [bacterium]|nr:hypothetical protein [bacterium]
MNLVAGERVSVPPDTTINIEHERSGEEEEIEFQFKWLLDDRLDEPAADSHYPCLR